MNWLNIHVSVLRRPTYIGAEPVHRATWLNVLAYCCEQENGGRIVGARKWKDRQWQQTCGVMLSEVNAADELLTWDGEDLLVWNYPTEKETEIRVKREAGRVGGERSGEARAKQPAPNKRSTASSLPSSSPPPSPSTEGEGEGEGEGERKGNDLFCAESAEPTSPPPPKEPILIFPCDGPVKIWHLTEEKLAEWQEAYPGMDVVACARDAKRWCTDNPQRRKTANGMTRFLGAWLSKAQNKGEHRRTAPVQEIAYFEPTHPDAHRPQDELLREAFQKNWADNPAAAPILEKLGAMQNGEAAP